MGKIDFTAEAIGDIKVLGDFIAEAGGRERAERYLRRLDQRIASLEVFPRAGSRLAAFGTGVRVIGYGRRVTILFRRRYRDVTILRVLYAGRQP